MDRKNVYVQQDASLLAIFVSRGEREPLEYLRAIALVCLIQSDLNNVDLKMILLTFRLYY